MSTKRGAVLALVLAATMAPPVGAQSGGSGFVLRSGKDTISVERFRREGGRLTGEIVIRMAQSRVAFEMEGDQAAVRQITTRFWNLTDSANAVPRQTATITFPADSAIAELVAPGKAPTVQRLGSRAGAIPYLNPSAAILEWVVERARRLTLPATVPMFAVAGGQVFDAVVKQGVGDSLVVTMAGGEMRLSVDGAGRVLGGVIPAQSLILERTEALSAAAFATEKVDYSAPAGAPYVAIDVSVPTPMGHRLAGTLTLPKTAAAGKPVPAVVTISGSGPQDRDEYIPITKDYRPFRVIADSLSRRGMAVLRMDDRGTGASEGNHSAATSADFADDIRAGLAFLRARPDIAGDRLALLGHSEGGLIAPMVAATDRRLAGIVLLAGPAYTGRRILVFQLSNNIKNDTSKSAAARDSAIAGVPTMVDSMGRAQKWLGFFLDYDPLATARKVTTPVLIVQGATDQQVTADQAPLLRKAFLAAGNRDVTMRVLPNMNHLFLYDPNGFPGGYAKLPNQTLDRGMVGLAVDWLAKRLKAR